MKNRMHFLHSSPTIFYQVIHSLQNPAAPALVVLLLLLVLASGGCGTLPNGKGWGEEALVEVNMERIGKAAHDAFFDWQTLLPLAGAAVFAIDDLDQQTSRWAVRHTPIFGSVDSARDCSDLMKDILVGEAFVTAVLTPSGQEADQWGWAKLKGGLVEIAAYSAVVGTTDLLKNVTDRQRPDKRSDNSFPSKHTSMAFSVAALSNRNLDWIDMPSDLRTGLKIGNVVTASGVAWARVEGERHYPSDVLFGAALGHFLTTFIHDAFMNLPEDGSVDFAVYPMEDGAGIQLAFRY